MRARDAFSPSSPRRNRSSPSTSAARISSTGFRPWAWRPAGRQTRPPRGHRRQSGRQIHLSEEPRPGPAVDGGGHACPRLELPRLGLLGPLHAVPQGRGQDHALGQAGRGAQPPRDHRRPDAAGLDPPAQRVLCLDQRAGGLGDHPAAGATESCQASPRTRASDATSTRRSSERTRVDLAGRPGSFDLEALLC